MAKLVPIPGYGLTEYVIKLLNNHKIHTAVEFLQDDATKTARITNLTLREVLNLRKKLVQTYGAQRLNGLQYYKKVAARFEIIPTGIKSLDELLDGGLHSGHLIEICGLPNTGKTLICNTIIMNICEQDESRVAIYIDTKNDFSALRIYEYLTNRGVDKEKIASIMSRIRVATMFLATEMLEYLRNLLANIILLENVKVVVIDSLPSIWLMYCGSNTSLGTRNFLLFQLILLEVRCFKGTRSLLEVSNMLRRLCDDYGIVVIVVNIVTHWTLDEDDDDDDEGFQSSTNTKTIINPTLGKHWQIIPSTRLLVEEVPVSVRSKTEASSSKAETKQTNEDNQRVIKIMKSSFFTSKKVHVVELTDRGVI